MAKQSAGVLLWRRRRAQIEVLIEHPGGPFFAHQDQGVWSIPKGEPEAGELAIDAAKREFHEELGVAPPAGVYWPLGEIRQRSGKIVAVWAVEGDFNPAALVSNLTSHGWPEVDRVEWVSIESARERLVAGQAELLDRLLLHVQIADI